MTDFRNEFRSVKAGVQISGNEQRKLGWKLPCVGTSSPAYCADRTAGKPGRALAQRQSGRGTGADRHGDGLDPCRLRGQHAFEALRPDVVELLVQGHDLDLRLQVDFVVESGR